jgi:hypothetical protein
LQDLIPLAHAHNDLLVGFSACCPSTTSRLPAKDCECQVIPSQADRPTDYDRRGFIIKSRNRVPTMKTAPPSQKAGM